MLRSGAVVTANLRQEPFLPSGHPARGVLRGFTYQQLRAAVAAMGPSVELVQDYLAAEQLLAQ